MNRFRLFDAGFACRSTTPRRRCYTFLMKQTLRTFEGYEPPPDPAEWQREHGRAPYVLADVHRKFHTRAAAAVSRDDSTIDADAALNAKAALDEILLTVHSLQGFDDKTHVFYDAATDTFLAYPRS